MADCQTKETKKFKKIVNTFIDEGHSIKSLVNQMGNYIMSEGCKLIEKKNLN